MSLFPAYSQQPRTEPTAQPPADTGWLTCSSFAVTLPLQDTPTEEDTKPTTEIRETEERPESSLKRKKNKKDDSRSSSEGGEKGRKKEDEAFIDEDEEEEEEEFFIDKERSMDNLSLNCIPKVLKPSYKLLYTVKFPNKGKRKKKRDRRYYQYVDASEGFKEGTLHEESLATKKTEAFNKILTDNPSDIKTWMEFVNFQDDFNKHQHIGYRSKNQRERAVAHRKLSILDKAISQNPENRELQELWLEIGTTILPSEAMSKRIEKILKESGGTMTLWLGLMTTTQHSLARCTVPSVRSLYEKLLLNFQKTKPPNTHGRDLNVLELLFHYGRFLDHTGHWESLWMMIKVNLQFNTKVNLNFDIKVDDERIKQLENPILAHEKQAVWQLWNRLERLRECLHFLPDADSVDYPQRCVSPESVVNFTWHFHPDLHFQLIVSFIVLLKVPLLSCTDTTLKMLSPNSLPWAFDSPEHILSSVLTSAAVSLKFDFLSCISQLSRGPQYLRNMHGQNEFLSLIASTFEACFKCLEGRKKFALGVWWLRFERWIHLLEKHNLASLPDDRKPAKSFFKDFLKVDENRDNVLYYIEYSLFEYSQGRVDVSLKTLQTLISSRPAVLNVSDDHEKAVLTSAYRSLCEVQIASGRRKEALDLLTNLGSGKQLGTTTTTHSFLSAEKKFEHVSIELINALDSESSCSLEDLLLPLFTTEWISCYFWLVALLKTPAHLNNCVNKIFALLDEHRGVVADQIRECLWETVVTVTWVFQRNDLLHTKELLKKTFDSYPRNLKVLSLMADFDLQNNAYWWTIKKFFLSTPTPFGCIFLICMALARFEKDKENFQKRVKNLLEDVALNEGKLLSMVHCLRLRFLYEYENLHIEQAQLQALEACPWNKSIYMESILLLPAKLMTLTDVLIEKELRIHITPDEVQEMRN